MADERKIIVDDDWKAQAEREKQRLAEETASRGGTGGGEPLPASSFVELINFVAMQALAGLGMLADAGGQRIPPDLTVAKHFVDMLQVLDDKTKGNLTPEEKRMLDQTLYEMRMRYVQMASAMTGRAV